MNALTINVGGRKFTTTMNTLIKYTKSHLYNIVMRQVPCGVDPNNRIFIDRDPDVFNLVLQFLRTNKLEIVINDVEKCELMPDKQFQTNQLSVSVYNNIAVLKHQKSENETRAEILSIGARRLTDMEREEEDELLATVSLKENEESLKKNVFGEISESFIHRGKSYLEYILEEFKFYDIRPLITKTNYLIREWTRKEKLQKRKNELYRNFLKNTENLKNLDLDAETDQIEGEILKKTDSMNNLIQEAFEESMKRLAESDSSIHKHINFYETHEDYENERLNNYENKDDKIVSIILNDDQN
ncbi:hypothetical protein SNEBB_009642 [Seison nebaliae]|nr:hypothetical protein SNEBB_009642 [Seison nebaliae]